MCLAVLGKVIRAGKLFCAHRACKRLGSRVRSHVPSKLIRARESPVTPLPLAPERPLPRVTAVVGLEVRALAVGLAASLPRADVLDHAVCSHNRLACFGWGW